MGEAGVVKEFEDTEADENESVYGGGSYAVRLPTSELDELDKPEDVELADEEEPLLVYSGGEEMNTSPHAAS